MNPTDSSPVYGYLRNPSMVDFKGHLAAVFFLSGCNFRCGFCHNATLMGRRRRGLSWEKLERVCREFDGNWVTGAVISGGEPTLHDELDELIDFFKGFGWAVKLDTNGSNPDRLAGIVEDVDYVAMDVKAGRTEWTGVTGYGRIDRILESIDVVRTRARDYEFRTTIIEDVHSDEEMVDIGRAIGGARRYVIQPFVPRDNLPDPSFRAKRRTSPDRLSAVAALMEPYVDEVIVRGQ